MANDVIQVNYEALERIQRDFTRCAEDAAQLHQRLKNGADRLVGSKWEGEAARQFFHEMDEEVLPAFDRLSKALTGCQDVTAELILEFRKAEEEAAALFKQDSAGPGQSIPDAGLLGSLGNSLLNGLKGVAHIFDPPLLMSEGVKELKNTNAGKDLLERAKNAGLYYVLRTYQADGTFTDIPVGGDPNGKRIPIVTGPTTGTQAASKAFFSLDSDGDPATDDQRILVSTDWADKISGGTYDPKHLAGTLAHEMQHGIDRNTDLSPVPWDDSYADDPEKLQTYITDSVTNSLTTESRAWAVGEAVTGNTPYTDDGVLSKEEAVDIFTNKNYEDYYEASYNEGFEEMKLPFRTDLWMDGGGNVHANLQRVTAK